MRRTRLMSYGYRKERGHRRGLRASDRVLDAASEPALGDWSSREVVRCGYVSRSRPGPTARKSFVARACVWAKTVVGCSPTTASTSANGASADSREVTRWMPCERAGGARGTALRNSWACSRWKPRRFLASSNHRRFLKIRIALAHRGGEGK